MKKFLHNLALRFFKRYIRVYQIDSYVSDVEMLHTTGDVGAYHRKEMVMVLRLVDKIMEDGLVEFTTNKDFKKMGMNLRAKIRVITHNI